MRYINSRFTYLLTREPRDSLVNYVGISYIKLYINTLHHCLIAVYYQHATHMA